MQKDELLRTIAHGETALKYLKANETPASPRFYELWYVYSSGINRELNGAVNDILRQQGSLSQEQADKIYDEFISPAGAADRVDQLSGELTSEVAEIIQQLTQAGGSVGQFGDVLKAASSSLSGIKSEAQLRPVVQSIIKATSSMQEQNAELEKKLIDSQAHIAELKQNLDTVRFEALTDQLTGLANRKRFDENLRQALSEVAGSDKPLCLVLGDVDHFKKFNDTYGHQTGDQVLRLVASTLQSNVKGRDTAARYGGEEFALILPDTSLSAAMTVAEQIRELIKGKELVKRSNGESLGRITMSFGVALYRANDNAETLIERADTALYAAKNAGRDRVLSENDKDKNAAVA